MNTFRNARTILGLLVTATVLMADSCGSPTTVVGEILSFNDNAAVTVNQNLGLRQLSAADTVSICGSDQGFLTELAVPGADLSKAKIPFEWAPVVPGTGTKWPTVDEPLFDITGTITASKLVSAASTDFMFAHPWSKDYSADFTVDSAYKAFNVTGGSMHLEIEQALMPHTGPNLENLWYTPQVGDRIAAQGDWILDCGHPPYGTEIHPPAFLAFAHTKINGPVRSSIPYTKAYAFVNPYRVTQLYTCNEDLSNQLNNYVRFSDQCTDAFPAHIREELADVALHGAQHTSGHVLVEPTNFNAVTWYVCRPANSVNAGKPVSYQYHFTMRNGIGIQAIAHDDLGCVQFLAVAGAGYKPAPLQRSVETWPWTQMRDFTCPEKADGSGPDVTSPACIDILQKLKDADPLCCNYILDRDPYKDLYPQLSTLNSESAENDSQRGFTTSDDQPFPFYGWATVA